VRIGYLFHGFLGDVKLDGQGNELSTPDGNATYSWSLEDDCERRRWQMIPLGDNRDAPAAKILGSALFSSFSEQRRSASYERMLRRGWTKGSDRKLPDLDMVLVEWRFPIPGRNTAADVGKPGYQGDLARQQQVLSHYGPKGVPIVIWDLDHKLTQEDIDRMSSAGYRIAVVETSARPRVWFRTGPSIRVEPPIRAADLLQHPIDRKTPIHHLGYIGSRYERDDVIDEWIGPIARPNTHRVKFWGKWEPDDEVRARWPGVTFAGRVGVKDFRRAYSRVAACPLLAKRSYLETGFITPRPWEAVLFGSIPIGFDTHLGVEDYVPTGLIAKDSNHLFELATWLRNMSPIRREAAREEAAHILSRCDARKFLGVLEGLV
jgi:hypothetical protein